MLLTSFASGSSGNCTYLSTQSEQILIDCGISARRISCRLKDLGKDLKDISAVLITHEHIDHVKALKRLINDYHIPVYCSYGTWNRIADVTRDEFFRFAGVEAFHPVSSDQEFYIGNTLIKPFKTYHDTDGPLGYRFEIEEPMVGRDANVAVLTDCGMYDDHICEMLSDLDALLIESNHDVDMLMNGPYPMSLKRRILSDYGHSSNETCARTIHRIDTPRLKDVILAHLSEENNTPEKALFCAEKIAGRPGLDICVAPKDELSKIIRY